MAESKFAQKLRERREAEARASAATASVADEYSDLIPEKESTYERSEEQLTIDRLIDNLGISEAYDRWIGKKRPAQRSGKKEGVMVSCPKPDHLDRNPSAWLNIDKNTWYCASCSEGGDVYDLASFRFGVPNYKSGKAFGELRSAIAQDFGYSFVTGPGLPADGVLVGPGPEEEASATAAPAPERMGTAPTEGGSPAPVAVPLPPLTPAPTPAGPVYSDDDAGLATVHTLPGYEEDDDEPDADLPGLDWRGLVTPGTFLDTYMANASLDDVPEEYHFWNALLAIGIAAGRDIQLFDYKPVLANLFICVLGSTGSGKSRATGYVSSLLEAALPHDWSDPSSRGARRLTTPGSAENLIHQFSKPLYDTSGAKPIVTGYAPVRGLVEFSELSALVGRAGRTGSVLKPVLMQFFDGDPRITSSSNTGGSHVAVDSFAAVVTSTQPKALKELLTTGDADSGFLNRWIFVSGTYKQRMAIGGVKVDLTAAAEKLSKIHYWCEPATPIDPPKEIVWSTQAAEAFTEFFHSSIEPLLLKSDNPFLARLDLICKKLCLLFTINEMLDEVPLSVIDKVKVVFDYLLAVYAVPAESVGRTVGTEIEDKILTFIENQCAKQKKHDYAVPLSHLMRQLEKNKNFTRQLIKQAIETLVAVKLLEPIVPEKKAGPGRPPGVRYRLAASE